jgi:hypothetical protein
MSIQRIKSGVIAEGAALNSVSDGVFFRNRIINGDMRIDQRNAGAATTVNDSGTFYTLDRWRAQGVLSEGVFTVQQDSSAPTSFNNSLKVTVTTADASVGATQVYAVQQRFEGYTIADLSFGTASAKTITISFWTRSSLTGTFGGAICNAAQDRNYPFTYTISVADTWEYKTVTIPGDTTGTWVTTNANALLLTFQIGIGTSRTSAAGAWNSTANAGFGANGATQIIETLDATWYVTGVQLEVGSVATPFERRPFGTELALCQRYAVMLGNSGNVYSNYGYGAAYTTTDISATVSLPVSMRAVPTVSFPGSGAFMFYRGGTNNTSDSANMAGGNPEATLNVGAYYYVSTGLTADTFGKVQSSNNTTTRILFSAEL